jgi:hypothetical protein
LSLEIDRINTDEDFINIKRFDYSLESLLERYPDGVPDRIIAQALNVSEGEVSGLYKSVVVRLRKLMGAQ